MKKINYFSEEGLTKAINKIKGRHKGGYELLIDKIIAQIKLFRKNTNSKEKLIVGISGGLDSTVVACLAKKAVGSKNIILVYLPARKRDEGLEYYSITKQYLRVKNTYLISIAEPTKDIIKIINKFTGKKLDPITEGNIASRIRVNVMYAIAKEKKGLILGTSNRTEFVQGYATKYGTPISCDFGVLDELYKTDILEIASRIKIPQEILQRKPTTGFYVGQTHEEELGATLPEQDAAAFLLFEKKLTIDEIIFNYGGSKKYLSEFTKKYHLSLHKRRLQSPHVSFFNKR